MPFRPSGESASHHLRLENEIRNMKKDVRAGGEKAGTARGGGGGAHVEDLTAPKLERDMGSSQ